ncbi:hypothetical protein EJB05_50036 [Eragrostis curvula]|uniref:Uncharacterized protein n=1 Tax=Eragrostis curvula TaxID=38414 RepID=A0A5J9SZF3_9POAL|nr:hypothetical protein EJB05_50036 [Eragrostis curvula]
MVDTLDTISSANNLDCSFEFFMNRKVYQLVCDKKFALQLLFYVMEKYQNLHVHRSKPVSS